MAAIREALSALYAAAALLPPLSFALIWAGTYLLTADKKTASRFAVHTTTLLLAGSVFVLLRELLHSELLLWLYGFIALVAIGFMGGKQYDRTGSIRLGSAVRVMSGFSFLILSFLYIVLFFAGIIKYIVNG